jgi:hypothetical protein
MSTSNISEAIARPVRTAGQLASSAVVVEFIDSFAYDLNEKQYAAAIAFLALVVGWVQVLIENRRGKALLRQVPPTTAPVVDVEPAQ